MIIYDIIKFIIMILKFTRVLGRKLRNRRKKANEDLFFRENLSFGTKLIKSEDENRLGPF